MEEKPNILLDYPVQIHRGASVHFARAGAEFFLDEHGIQWAKYTPMNGYAQGKQHMVRTDSDGFIVVRDDR